MICKCIIYLQTYKNQHIYKFISQKFKIPTLFQVNGMKLHINHSILYLYKAQDYSMMGFSATTPIFCEFQCNFVLDITDTAIFNDKKVNKKLILYY